MALRGVTPSGRPRNDLAQSSHRADKHHLYSARGTWATTNVNRRSNVAGRMTPCRLERIGAPVLWALVPGSPKGIAVLKPVCRENFLEAMLKGEYPKGIISPKVFKRRLSVPQVIPSRPHTWKPQSFEQYMARKSRARKRMRF